MIPKSLIQPETILQKITCLLPGFKNATIERQRRALVKIFQDVFSSPQGKIVLNALLKDLHYFDKAESSDEVALCEYAKYFLRERLDIVNSFDVSNAFIASINTREETE